MNNDAGIVSFKGADGTEKAYAITYMSQMAGSEKIGYSFGAKLSRDVWDWMAGEVRAVEPADASADPAADSTADARADASADAGANPPPTPSPSPTAVTDAHRVTDGSPKPTPD